MRRRSRRPGALGYDSWQGDPIVMPPRDAVDAKACAAIDAAARELRLCAMPADPSDEAHNRAKLAEGIAAAEGMTGPNRTAWRGLHLRRLVTSFVALTLPDDDASRTEEDKLRRDLGLTNSH